MPRIAANLAYLFTERPLLARFGAAAGAGFKAVELQTPYDEQSADIRREIERHGLTMLGINTPGASGGQGGVAGVPGREAEFAALFARSLHFAVGIGAKTISAPRRPIWPIVVASASSPGPNGAPRARMPRHISQALPINDTCMSQ